MRRGVNDTDQGPIRQVRRRDILPTRAHHLARYALSHHPFPPTVHPPHDAIPPEPKLCNTPRHRYCPRDRSARCPELVWIVARQILAQHFEARAQICRQMQAIAGHIKQIGIMPREHDRESPLKAVFQSLAADTPAIELGPNRIVPDLTRAMIIKRHDVVVGALTRWTRSHNIIRIIGLDGDITAFTATPGSTSPARESRHPLSRWVR